MLQAPFLAIERAACLLVGELVCGRRVGTKAGDLLGEVSPGRRSAGGVSPSVGFDVLVEVEDVVGVVGGLERPEAGELGG
jgi:hypothetical protein